MLFIPWVVSLRTPQTNTRKTILTGILDGNLALIPATSSLRLTKIKRKSRVRNVCTFSYNNKTTKHVPYANYTINWLTKTFPLFKWFCGFCIIVTHFYGENKRLCYTQSSGSNQQRWFLVMTKFAPIPTVSQLRYQLSHSRLFRSTDQWNGSIDQHTKGPGPTRFTNLGWVQGAFLSLTSLVALYCRGLSPFP